MPERQLRLFEHPKPLLARLGADFFKSVPQCPGVYLMFNDANRLLYVGQSSNLRVRLGTYKNANPDHVPRKVLRLVHSVARITLEPCDTPIAARLRENQLLRTHRPRFNRMNTWPKAYWFVGCRHEPDRLRLWLTLQPEDPEHLYGAFKANTRAAFGALLRVLGRPASLTRPPRTAELPSRDDIKEFLSGTSDRFIAEARPMDDSPFGQALFAHDHDLLTRFYQAGPLRYRKLCDAHNLPLIPQDQLDDLLLPLTTKA